MTTIVYSRQFRAEMSNSAYDLRNFFNKSPHQNINLGQYRQYLRHLDDFDRFQNDLDDIETGKKSLSRIGIGTILLNKKTYILHVGPWRGYLRKRKDGAIVALLFVDCR